MAIGAALAVAIVISGPVSGAGVNPARAIGPMILAGQVSDWWAYLEAPVLPQWRLQLLARLYRYPNQDSSWQPYPGRAIRAGTWPRQGATGRLTSDDPARGTELNVTVCAQYVGRHTRIPASPSRKPGL